MADVRLSDAEREAAVNALSEHYAAGRLTKDEYDDRSQRAFDARFASDLPALFEDLPGGQRASQSVARGPQVAPWRSAPSGFRRPPRFLPLVGIAMLGVISAIVVAFNLPWLLLGLFIFFMCRGAAGRRASWNHHMSAAGGPRYSHRC